MANKLLDPMSREDEDIADIPSPEYNPSQQDFEEKFHSPSTAADYAARDQRDAAVRDTGTEIPYSPDSSRRQLAKQESSGRAGDKGVQASEELPYTGGVDSGDGSQPNSKGSRIRGLLGNKKAQGGLLGGGILGILISGFIGIQPFQVLHIAQMLQNWHFFDDDQASNWSTRRIYNYAAGQRQFNNLGVAANLVANKFERRLSTAGIELDYKDPNGSSRASAQKMRVDTNTPEGEAFARRMEAEFPDSVTRNGDFVDINLRGQGSSRIGKSVISAAVDDVLQMNKVNSALSKRLLKRRAGVNFHPLRNLRDRAEDREDARRAKNEDRERRAQEAKDGVDENAYKNRGDLGSDPDGNPNPETDIDEANRGAASDLIDETTGFSDEDVGLDKKSSLDEFSRRFISQRAAGFAGASVAIVGLTCAARDIGNESETFQHKQTILPMIRMSMQIIAAGSQILVGSEEGDISAESIASISETFYDIQAEEEEAGTGSFFAAKPVQAEMGKEPLGPDVPDSAKPGELGEKPLFFEKLDEIPGLEDVCGVNTWVNNTIGAIPGVSQATEFISNAASGGIEAATGKGTDEWMEELLSLLAGEGVDTLATGAELGGLASYGSKLASNDAMMAMGGTELNGTDLAQWKEIQTRTLLAQRKHQSLYTRVLDLKNPYSLSAIALLETPATTSPTAFADVIRKRPTGVFAGIKESVARALTPSAYAQQTGTYSYGFGDFGFSPSILNDERYANPYCNAAIVAGGSCIDDEGNESTYPNKLPDYNDRWGKCFGDPVDDQGNLTGNAVEDYKDVGDCAGESGGEFNRYKVYLLDRTTNASLVCYENIDEAACEDIGLNESGESTPSGSNPGGSIIGDPYSDTTEIPCAPGTKDIGLQDAYVNGRKFESTMCSVSNIPSSGQADNPGSRFSTPGAEGNAIVNSRVSGAWYKLAEDAKAAGINLTVGSSFRSMAHQEFLWADLGMDSQRVARPGYSSHQAGVALDFNNMRGPGVKRGATCANRAEDSGPGYRWLTENAASYGFKQYAAEAWHWDALPAASRC